MTSMNTPTGDLGACLSGISSETDAITSGVRKFALTTHVTSSVGWFGAVAAFCRWRSRFDYENAQTVRGAYLSMELTTGASSSH